MIKWLGRILWLLIVGLFLYQLPDSFDGSMEFHDAIAAEHRAKYGQQMMKDVQQNEEQKRCNQNCSR